MQLSKNSIYIRAPTCSPIATVGCFTQFFASMKYQQFAKLWFAGSTKQNFEVKNIGNLMQVSIIIGILFYARLFFCLGLSQKVEALKKLKVSKFDFCTKFFEWPSVHWFESCVMCRIAPNLHMQNGPKPQPKPIN